MKNCPVCNIPLRPVSPSSNLQLDYCIRCKGVWFDHQELDRAAGHADHRMFLRKLSTPSLAHLVCKSCDQTNDRKNNRCVRCLEPLHLDCPLCGQNLEATKSGAVEMDRCRNCRGVWLDGGELELLFEEFQKQRKQNRGLDGAAIAAGAADATLEMMIWTPHLFYYAASGAIHAAAELPGVIASGTEAAIGAAAHIPDLAAGAAESAVEVAGFAADLSGSAIQGVAEFASNIPEVAGGAADLFGSFIEFLIGLISD